jgi:hypothetical protein
MITRPTTAQLIDVVRRALAERVAPAVTDPQARTSLHMVDHVLRTLAIRAEGEAGWMTEEIAAIEALGDQVADSGLPGAAAVADALAAFRAGRGAGGSIGDLTADYDAATEVLSRCLEATFALEGDLRDAVIGLLDERLGHEMEVIGPDFRLVGRD